MTVCFDTDSVARYGRWRDAWHRGRRSQAQNVLLLQGMALALTHTAARARCQAQPTSQPELDVEPLVDLVSGLMHRLLLDDPSYA